MKARFYLILIVILGIIAGGAWFVFSKEEKVILYVERDFVAQVNNKTISIEDLQERINFIIKITEIPYENKNFNKNEFKNIILQKLIEETLIFEEVEKLEITVDDIVVKTKTQIAFHPFAEYNSEYTLFNHNISKEDWEVIYKKTLIKKAFFGYLKTTIPINQADIDNYYKLNASQLVTPKQYEVQHIQVNSLEVANFLVDRIKNGSSFSRLIRQYSIAESNGSEGEDSFFVKENTLPKTFNDAIFKLNLKKPTTSVLESKFGYHLFNLKKIVPRKKLSLAEAREQIIKIIQDEKVAQKYKDWLANKFKISDIIVNYQLLEDETAI